MTWILFVADRTRNFPNFFPIGIFESETQAKEQLNTLPKNNHYQLFQLPVNTFFGVVGQDGVIQSELGNFHHEHFEPKED